jgi:hypothetical protein
MRYLREMQSRRDLYKSRYAAKLDRAQEKLKNARDDAAKKVAATELAKLAKPMERMFQQLKDRLNKLPTQAQLAKAAQAEAAATAKPGTSGEKPQNAPPPADKPPAEDDDER